MLNSAVSNYKIVVLYSIFFLTKLATSFYLDTDRKTNKNRYFYNEMCVLHQWIRQNFRIQVVKKRGFDGLYKMSLMINYYKCFFFIRISFRLVTDKIFSNHHFSELKQVDYFFYQHKQKAFMSKSGKNTFLLF